MRKSALVIMLLAVAGLLLPTMPAAAADASTCRFGAGVENGVVNLYGNFSWGTGRIKYNKSDDRDSFKGHSRDTCTGCEVTTSTMRLEGEVVVRNNAHNASKSSDCVSLWASSGPYTFYFPRVLWGACQPSAQLTGGVRIDVGTVNGKYVPRPAVVWADANTKLMCGVSCWGEITGNVNGKPQLIIEPNSDASYLYIKGKLNVTPSAYAKAMCWTVWSWKDDNFYSAKYTFGSVGI